jgi:hypothetical protein
VDNLVQLLDGLDDVGSPVLQPETTAQPSSGQTLSFGAEGDDSVFWLVVVVGAGVSILRLLRDRDVAPSRRVRSRGLR